MIEDIGEAMKQNEALVAKAEKPVRHISYSDYEAQKLWRDVALQNISRGTSAAIVIEEADSIAQAYIKFVNNQENN